MTAAVVQNDVTPNDESSAVLQDLLRRVESATGADRELDSDLTDAFDPPQSCARRWPYAPGSQFDYECGRLSASLDAALGLVERVLPGWSWGVSGALGPICDGMLYAPSETGYRLKIRCKAATPPLALLAALLRALIASQEAGHAE